MPELMGESLMRNRLSSYLKEPPHKIFINSKGTNNVFIVEKSGRHHLMQAIKVNINNNGTN